MIVDNISHAPFCTVQPGESGPRIESFRAERSDEHGVVVARPRVNRCMDCGEQTIEG